MTDAVVVVPIDVRSAMTCVGCSCQRAEADPVSGRLLVSTRVSHTRAALHDVVSRMGAAPREVVPGLLDVDTADPGALVQALREQLSTVEASEVRALVCSGEEGDALLAAALSAPTLAQMAARVEHADLLPLLDDERESFYSAYQPIVALVDDEPAPVGFEALLRARSAQGEVLPGTLFAAAERAGWLHVLDRVGRTTALRDAAGWLGDRMLFVNFLPTTIYRPEVCLATTERAAARAGLRLNQLVFEVTESERVSDLGHLEDVFAHYRDRGCGVALDDLGSGYSSLNMLVQLQPDVVKLDKEIVQKLPAATSRAVVSAVVDITHAYGGKVLAECVETAEQAAAARDLGVDLGQGWFFGRPEPRRSRELSHPVDPAGSPGVSSDRFAGDDPAVAIAAT